MYDFAYIECSVPAGVRLPTYRANRTSAMTREIIQLKSELANKLDAMSEVMERWVEARAGGRDTSPCEHEWKELERQFRRLERRIRRREKAERKRSGHDRSE